MMIWWLVPLDDVRMFTNLLMRQLFSEDEPEQKEASDGYQPL
jgi:hypothetical protein